MSQPLRTFLGWDRPLLHSLRDYVRARGGKHDARSDAFAGGVVDLSDWVVVLPGARAGRRLVELLSVAGQGEVVGGGLIPPRVTTPQGMWDVVGNGLGTGPAATSLEDRLAWACALRRMPPEELHSLVRHRPEADEVARWIALGELLSSARSELAAAGKRLSDMPEIVKPLADDTEASRWESVARAEAAYMSELARAGLRDRHAMRDETIKGVKRAGTARVIVAGVVDLNMDARRLIDAIGDECEVVVFAPPEFAAGFDPYGVVVPEWWKARPIAVDEARIRTAATRDEQADVVLGIVQTLAEGRPADQVTIGVPEPVVAQRLMVRSVELRVGDQEADGVRKEAWQAGESLPPRFRLAAGHGLDTTPPGMLIAMVRDFVSSGSFEDFGTLVRHCDVGAVIDRVVGSAVGHAAAGERTKSGLPFRTHARTPYAAKPWLDVLDEYQAEYLHWMVDGEWHTGDDDCRGVLSAVYSAVMALLGGLIDSLATNGRSASRTTISEWCARVGAMLERVYGQRIEEEAVGGVVEAVMQLQEASARIGKDLECDAAHALEVILRVVGEAALADESGEAGIELLGWLELAMDDAAVTVVTGMNEGVIPSPVGSDPLLPNSIRARVGLATRESRYARDAWIMSVLAHAKASTVFVCAKRGERNEPRLPSRLLLAADPLTVAQRIEKWTSEEVAVHEGGIATTGVGSARVGGEPDPAVAVTDRLSGATPTSLRVTAFRDYLDSPRGFFLRHVARLSEPEANLVELGAMHFGTLLHDVLRALPESEAAYSQDPRRVGAFLHATLEAAATQRFGRHPMPAVWIQLQQAHARLEAVARWQAKWAAAGWRIAHVEWSPPDNGESSSASIVVDGAPMGLRGRIDRIDINDRLGCAAILDYKTGERAPELSAIRKANGEWLDLQLPLYRHLARSLDLQGRIELGYIVLPRDPAETGERLFSWDEGDLESADDTAGEVVRAVRRGEYDELGPRPPTEGILARICGTAYLRLDEEEDEVE